MNPNEASYTLLDHYVQNFTEALQNVFSKHNVQAPVTTDNVINASIAMKKTDLNKDIAKAVGYGGESYQGTEDFGGKILSFATKAKLAVNKVKSKVSDVKEKVSGTKKDKEPEPKPEPPKDKKVLGLNPYVFYGILTIVILAIVITIIKLAK